MNINNGYHHFCLHSHTHMRGWFIFRNSKTFLAVSRYFLDGNGVYGGFAGY